MNIIACHQISIVICFLLLISTANISTAFVFGSNIRTNLDGFNNFTSTSSMTSSSSLTSSPSLLSSSSSFASDVLSILIPPISLSTSRPPLSVSEDSFGDERDDGKELNDADEEKFADNINNNNNNNEISDNTIDISPKLDQRSFKSIDDKIIDKNNFIDDINADNNNNLKDSKGKYNSSANNLEAYNKNNFNFMKDDNIQSSNNQFMNSNNPAPPSKNPEAINNGNHNNTTKLRRRTRRTTTTTTTLIMLTSNENNDDDNDGYNILLWLPYVIFTVVLLSLILMSFVRFHCQRGDQYRRRREELEDKPVLNGGKPPFSSVNTGPIQTTAIVKKNFGTEKYPTIAKTVPDHLSLFLKFSQEDEEKVSKKHSYVIRENNETTGRRTRNRRHSSEDPSLESFNKTMTTSTTMTQPKIAPYLSRSSQYNKSSSSEAPILNTETKTYKKNQTIAQLLPKSRNVAFTFNSNGSMVDVRCINEERSNTFRLSEASELNLIPNKDTVSTRNTDSLNSRDSHRTPVQKSSFKSDRSRNSQNKTQRVKSFVETSGSNIPQYEEETFQQHNIQPIPQPQLELQQLQQLQQINQQLFQQQQQKQQLQQQQLQQQLQHRQANEPPQQKCSPYQLQQSQQPPYYPDNTSNATNNSSKTSTPLKMIDAATSPGLVIKSRNQRFNMPIMVQMQ
ncbi:hypothetical protein HELRODRAFT_162456 [Helobdella robusta]|uniref:Uncharacterized protein n=1 Tax=Helobdella robusta TaxID=6412 RepID=T1ESP4_HELRO|nr:hypothetical protein HELRODRAFT_162456 [Helobdella robusta]ESN98982.1 hypothetical protein HELRODRAFT_162456 [Helobdella robusta]